MVHWDGFFKNWVMVFGICFGMFLPFFEPISGTLGLFDNSPRGPWGQRLMCVRDPEMFIARWEILYRVSTRTAISRLSGFREVSGSLLQPFF